MKFALVFLFSILISLPGLAEEEDHVSDIIKERQKFQKSIPEAPFDITTLSNPVVIEKLREDINRSAIDQLPFPIKRGMFMGKLKGSAWYKILNDFPKLRDFIVDFLTDKKTILGILGILLKKDQLKIFVAIFLGLLLVRWLSRKYLLPSEAGFLRSALSMFLSLSFTLITAGVFYRLFAPQIDPAITVIKRHI